MTRVLAMLLLAALPGACGPAAPVDARVAQVDACERRLGRILPDSAKGEALCSCMVDDLAKEGLAFTDMLGPHAERVEAITSTCAQRVGVSLPDA